MIPAALAAEITAQLKIPTIGIGAGAACDGQVLVSDDLLGIYAKAPKFVKKYAALDTQITQAVNKYLTEVKTGKFPAAEHSF